MMETQKILKPDDKIVIVSDFREKEISGELKKLGALVNQISLDIGDFVCSERVAIERKTYSDFISSIIDGRIFEQATILKENFERPIIIIEGYSNNTISENALKGAIASLLIDFGIPLVATRNQLDTAKIIFWIAKKEQSEGKQLAIKVGRKPKDAKAQKEHMICSLPGVSIVLAKRLLEKFGTVEKVFCASEDELQEVKRIGKKLAQKIRNAVSANY